MTDRQNVAALWSRRDLRQPAPAFNACGLAVRLTAMKVALLLLTLALGAVPGLLRATEVHSRVVTFTNGWQPGLISKGELRVTGAGASNPTWTFQFTLVTDAVENNLGLTYNITGFTPEPARPEEELLAQMTGAVALPDFLIATSGRFVSLKDLPGLRRTLRDNIRATLGRLRAAKSDPENFERFVEMGTSQELLEGRVAEDWHRMVSRWIGKRVAVGKEYPFDDVVLLPIPRSPLPKLAMHGTYSVSRLELCDRSGAAQTCAVLKMHLKPDEADLKRITQEVYGNTPTAGKDPGDVATMEVTVDAEIVTEPDGLLPHRYAITKKIAVSLSADGKNSQHTLDQREATFTYP
jgi:hypothetical protein